MIRLPRVPKTNPHTQSLHESPRVALEWARDLSRTGGRKGIVLVYTDNPYHDANVLQQVFGEIAIRKDAFHVLQKFFLACKASHKELRQTILSGLSDALYVFNREDIQQLEHYMRHRYEQHGALADEAARKAGAYVMRK